VYRVLPESVVWLCANNRVDEAEHIIRNAAKLNNIEMPDNILAGKQTELDETSAAAAAEKSDGQKVLQCCVSNSLCTVSDKT